MKKTIILMVMSDDRPGLVHSLSDVIYRHGGSWDKSTMANLAGQFAGMITITVDESRASDLAQDLRGLSAEGMIVIVGEGSNVTDNDAPLVSLEITGHDRPGIMHEVSSLCSDLGGNLSRLKTDLVSGSMSGEALFIASAQLQVGANTCLDTVKAALESLSDDLMVDIVMTDEQTKSS